MLPCAYTKCEIVDTLIQQNLGGIRDRFSEMEDVTIPYSNCSQSVKDSWFVPISTLVPTTNAKSLTPLFRGDSEIWAGLGIGSARCLYIM